MKKIKYNPRIVKKTVLLAILGLIVVFFGYSVVVSFISNETTTKCQEIKVDVPAGDYRDFLLNKVGMNPDQYNESVDAELFKNNLTINSPANQVPIYGTVSDVEGDPNTVSSSSYIQDKDYIVEELGNKQEAEAKVVKEGVLTDEGDTVTYEFDIPVAGFYHIELDYVIPYIASEEGSYSSAGNVERRFYVNGEIQYNALESMVFTRVYRDSEADKDYYLANKELREDKNGNNIKPSQVEMKNIYRTELLQDNTGYVRDPYLVYFEKAGTNTITIETIREPLVVFSIAAKSTNDYFDNLKTYEEYVNYYTEQGATKTKGFIETYQAEDSLKRTSSSPTLYPISDRNSSANTPSDPVLQKYNAVGGSKWSNVGDYLEWTVYVEEEGFYNIAFRTKQDLARGLSATRKLYVNGEVPFREAENCRFTYDSNYSITKLGDTKGNAYDIYLQKGYNKVQLKATVGDYAELISEVKLVSDELNSLYLSIIAITTPNPDKYQTYNLYGENSRLDVDMCAIFKEAAEKLKYVSNRLSQINGEIEGKAKGEKSTYNTILDELALQIGEGKGFASKPRNVTQDLAAFKTNLSALGTWVLDIQSQSLTIESFTIYSSDKADSLPKSEDNFFVSFWYDIKGFFLSFFFDYESVGVTEQSAKKSIEVWYLSDASSGREQCNAIKSLIDQTFIPKTNINVVLKIVAPGVLLPATLAGTGPDVAINVDGGLPVNYALRGAVYDMREQKTRVVDEGEPTERIVLGYEDFINQKTSNGSYQNFTPAQLTPFTIVDPNGEEHTYGLPNTMSFYVMFYRTDIFEKNGWSVPTTWDDVIDLVTDMQVSNLQFYMPLEGDGGTMFATLLYQRGGNYYAYEDWLDIEDPTLRATYLKNPEILATTALDEEISLQVFEQWCSFFTDYSFELAANFSNRFRSGEMPIGISSYTLFNTLAVFAPDIAGKWAFAPLPGQITTPDDPLTEENEQVVDNSTILGQTAVVIMKDSKKKDESWEFVTWWTSTDTQTLYAKEMESILGSAARHNTANIEAMKNLAWTAEESEVLIEMWEKAKSIPAVPGSYYIGRNLENSIRAVINNDANPRETFKEYIEQINAEITRKRIEFGFEKAKK